MTRTEKFGSWDASNGKNDDKKQAQKSHHYRMKLGITRPRSHPKVFTATKLCKNAEGSGSFAMQPCVMKRGHFLRLPGAQQLIPKGLPQYF